jgi:hypothetical protein
MIPRFPEWWELFSFYIHLQDVAHVNNQRRQSWWTSSSFQVFCWGQMRLWLNWENHFGRDSLVIGRRRTEWKNKWRRTGYSSADIKSMTWHMTPLDCFAAAYSAAFDGVSAEAPNFHFWNLLAISLSKYWAGDQSPCWHISQKKMRLSFSASKVIWFSIWTRPRPMFSPLRLIYIYL